MTTAVELLSLSVILDFGANEWEGHGLSAALSSPSGMAEELLTLCLAIVMIVGVARGRNWARILYLTSCALVWGALEVSYALGTLARLTPIQGLSLIVQTILAVVTAYLLCTEPARSWFRRAEE